MPTVTTDDGVALSYATAGDGPPNLLFMHGWAGSGRYFDATIEHLDLTRLRRGDIRPPRPPRVRSGDRRLHARADRGGRTRGGRRRRPRPSSSSWASA